MRARTGSNPPPSRRTGGPGSARGRLLARAGRRTRLQRALSLATACGALGLLAVSVLVALDKWWGVHLLGLPRALALAAAWTALGGVVGALRPLSSHRLAQRLDAAFGLDDRLRSALDFEARPPNARSAFEQAAIDDAERRVVGLDPRRAIAISMPRTTLPLAGLAVLVIVLSQVEVAPPSRSAPEPPTQHARLIHEDDVDAFRDAVTPLREEIEAAPESEALQETSQALNALLEALAHRDIDRLEALRRISALEARLRDAQAADAERLREALEALAAELEESRVTRSVAAALREVDLEAAERALKEAAQRVREDGLPEAERRGLAEALRRAGAEPAGLERLRQQIEKRRKLLRRKEAQAQASPDQQRLLKRKRRELERLEREARERSRAERQLDRLRRDLSQAAQQLERQRNQGASEDMQRGAEDLERMRRQQRAQRASQRMAGQLRDLRELIRRGRPGNGGEDRPQGPGRALDQTRFARLARGGESGPQGQQGQGQGTRQQLLRRGEGQGEGQSAAARARLEARAGRRQGSARGSAAGDAPSKPELGERTQIDGSRADTRVRAQSQGEGPSRSEVILEASQRGFASQPYEKVFGDYARHAESVVERDQIPRGYRFYVRRYFQLIRPREEP